MEFRFKRPIANLSRRRKRIYTYRNHVRWMIHVLTFPFRAKCMRIKFAPETGYAPRYQSLTRKPFDEKIPYCNLISRTDVNCIRANRFLPLSLCLVSFDKLLRKLSINSKGWGDRSLRKIWHYAICKEHLSFNGTGTWEEEREEKKLGAESMVVVRRYRSGGRDPQCHFYAGVWVRRLRGNRRRAKPASEPGVGKWIDRSIDRRISISYASAPVIFSVRRKCQAVMKNLPCDDQTALRFALPGFIGLFPRRVLAA